MVSIVLTVAVALFVVVCCIITAVRGQHPTYASPYNTRYDATQWVWGTIMTAVAVGVICVFGFLLAALVGSYGTQKYEPYQWNIIAANDGSATTGRFGLFSGYIDEQFRYYYYYKDNSGGIRLGWVAANRSQIFEDAPQGTGYIESTHPVSYWNKWGYVEADDPTFKVHIPAGSVIEQYRMDLQN